ncbi:MAG TPA: helix-turn-helix domain-containing protein [Ktedonobacteraceae bacterium]|nr:helix-turn-helix domain-containing protein [Ktedonobacteraceae bacterium]
MAKQNEGTHAPSETRSKRQGRADRILDAAAELLLRWGYKKTTIDDIAKQARVAKGTIYLHWKTREDLFEALLTREWLGLMQEFIQHLSTDPEGGTLYNMISQACSMTMSRPLIRAALLRDIDMLGDILHTTSGAEVIRMRIQFGTAYMELLRNKGMLRTDIDLTTQIKMLGAIFTGFFIIDPYMPDELKFSLPELVDALTETIRRTFEPPEPPSPEAVQEVTRYLQQGLQQLLTAVQAMANKETEA